MSDRKKPPCRKIPHLEPIEIPLPFGSAISSLTNVAEPPSQCALVHSVMLQLAPLLAGMTCFLRVLQVMGALKKALEQTPVNPVTVLTNLIEPLADLSKCLLLIDPLKLCQTIAAILKLIIGYLGCVIDAFESVSQFKAGIALTAETAGDNTVLLGTLECAEQNAQTSLDNLNNSMQGVIPLIELVNMLIGIVGGDLKPIELPPMTTPSPAEIVGGKDPLEPVKKLRDALQLAYDALPCK